MDALLLVHAWPAPSPKILRGVASNETTLGYKEQSLQNFLLNTTTGVANIE